jgi:hypothetical protein
MRTLIAATIVVALLVTAPAMAASPDPQGTSDIAAVERAEHRWMQAMMKRDEAMLNRLVASSFTLGGLDDLERPPVPRQIWIDNTLHHLKVGAVTFRTLKVTVAGDVAIARAVFRWSGSFDAETFDDTSLLVDTWVRQGTSWVVVSRLVGDAPKPEPTAK